MNKNEFGIPAFIKSIGLPVVSDGYIIDYCVNGSWKHFCGVEIINGTNDHPDDLEFATRIIDMNTKEGVTRNNVSHIARIYDYDGDPHQLNDACTDVNKMNKLVQGHNYKILIINKELFKKFNEYD